MTEAQRTRGSTAALQLLYGLVFNQIDIILGSFFQSIMRNSKNKKSDPSWHHKVFTWQVIQENYEEESLTDVWT